jgi:hypothetical protein
MSPEGLQTLIVKCLFFRSCTAGKLRSNFISLETTAFVRLTKQMRIHTASVPRQCSHLACVGYAYRVHYNYDLALVWNETGVHWWTKVYLLFECEHQRTAAKTLKQEHILYSWTLSIVLSLSKMLTKYNVSVYFVNILDKDKTMDNVQEYNICTNLPSSQTLRSYWSKSS